MKILANDGIENSAIESLAKAGFELITTKVAQEQLAVYIQANNIEVLLVRSATKVRKELIDQCPSLKMIGRGGVGMDNIDVLYAREKGIRVVNTPASSSDSVAELVFAHLFGMVRFLHDSNRQMPLSGETHFAELKKAYSQGTELNGKTLGIVGAGRIGKAVARRAIGLGMNVLFADQHPGNHIIVDLDFFDSRSLEFKFETIELEALLTQSDFISLHVPGSKDGALIDQRELAMMKPGSGIINAARGGVINELALLEALNNGHLAYAGLDVFENEPNPAVQLLMHSQISLSPHIGAATKEAQERIGGELAGLIIEAFGTVKA